MCEWYLIVPDSFVAVSMRQPTRIACRCRCLLTLSPVNAASCRPALWAAVLLRRCASVASSCTNDESSGNESRLARQACQFPHCRARPARTCACSGHAKQSWTSWIKLAT
eukprot:4770275-Prymnesium_polylepis.1